MPEARRRWWQFSLRTLLLLVTASAVVLGVVCHRVSTISRELRAELAALSELTALDDELFVAEPQVDGTIVYHFTLPASLHLHLPLEVDYRDRTATNFDWLLAQDLLATQHVEAIALRWQDDAEKWLRRAEYFPYLRRLTLKECQNVDAVLQGVRKNQRLEEIRLLNTDVTDEGLACLQGLKNLRNVVVTHSAVTDAGLAHLSRLPKLHRLKVFDSHVTDSGLAAVLQDCSWELDELYVDLAAREGPEAHELISIRFPHLKLLKIGGAQLRLRLEHLAELEELDVREAAEVSLDDLPSLQKINAKDDKANHLKAARIELRNLPQIKVVGCSVTKSCRLENLERLEELNVCGGRSTTSQIRLTGLPNLRSVWLARGAWTGLSEREWASMSSLRELRVYGDCRPRCQVEEKDACVLARASALESLEFINLSLSDEAAKPLSELPRLSELTFTHSDVSAAVVQRLRLALPACAIRPDHNPPGRCAGSRHSEPVDEEDE